MGLHTEESEQPAEQAEPALSAELSRILESTRQQLVEVFRDRLESAVRDAGSAAMKLAESEREQALIDARIQLSAELRGQFDQTLQQTTSRMQAEFEERLRVSTAQWDAEKGRLNQEMNALRTLTDTQRQMAESRSQSEILGHFLDGAEVFAPNLAVYVSKADGLALWKTRGTTAFPELVSKETIDPEAYFRPIVVRERTVAAVCARQPLKSESLDFLSSALARAIESFGARLQSRPSKPVAS
jgi:hypothetical protein